MAQASGDKKKIARLSNSTGISHATSGNFEKSLDAFYTALSIYQEFGMERQVLLAKKNIAKLQGQLFKTDKALALLQEIQQEARQKGLHRLACKTELMQAQHYEDLLLYEEAEKTLLSALELAEAREYLERISCYESLGRIYSKTNQIPKATEYLGKGLVLALESGLPHYIASLYTSVGDHHVEQEEFPEAITAYQSVFSIMDTTDSHTLMDLCRKMAEAHKGARNFEAAYNFGEKAIKIQENLYTP